MRPGGCHVSPVLLTVTSEMSKRHKLLDTLRDERGCPAHSPDYSICCPIHVLKEEFASLLCSRLSAQPSNSRTLNSMHNVAFPVCLLSIYVKKGVCLASSGFCQLQDRLHGGQNITQRAQRGVLYQQAAMLEALGQRGLRCSA